MSVHDDVRREHEAATASAAETELPASLTDRVLMMVRKRRFEDDGREGILRDFPDGTCGRRYLGPTSHTDRQAVLEAQGLLYAAVKSANPSWRNHLEVAVARVLAEPSEEVLEERLVELSAVAVAWVEGIRMRADRRRIDREEARRIRVIRGGQIVEGREVIENGLRLVELPSQRRSWWRRFLDWLNEG